MVIITIFFWYNKLEVVLKISKIFLFFKSYKNYKKIKIYYYYFIFFQHTNQHDKIKDSEYLKYSRNVNY